MDHIPAPTPEAERVAEARRFVPDGRMNGPSEQTNSASGAANRVLQLAEGSPSKPRFSIISVDDIELGDEPAYLIDDLLPSSGFGIVFGPPKGGKSFIVSDALFSVACNRAWAGRNVRQGAVAYITAEGVKGFERRLIALRRHYGVEGKGVPFGMIPAAPDFGHATDDAGELVVVVKEWLAHHGNPPLAAIVIDTLARTMKGADENTAKDMTTFVENCDTLGKAFGCLVLGVHHAGKDASRGSRGSNALDGAVDVMWSIEKGEKGAPHIASIHYMKDGEAGMSWQFRLAPFTIREATETKPEVSTCVVEIASEPTSAKLSETRTGKVQLTPVQARFFSILKEAISESGTNVRGSPVVPHDRPSITRSILKNWLITKGWADSERTPDSIRAQINTNLNNLAGRGLIGLTKEHLWLIADGGQQ